MPDSNATNDDTYRAGKRDGLSKALEIIDNHLGPQEPERPLEITAAIRAMIARSALVLRSLASRDRRRSIISSIMTLRFPARNSRGTEESLLIGAALRESFRILPRKSSFSRP
jgi:hypothetical protein